MVADRALAAFARLGPGARVGRYTIIRAGGVGGMAAVWLAREDGTGARVALKTMLPAFSMRPEHEKMFLAEGKIAARVEHPNVCRVRDVGEGDGVPFIVMDWIRGGSLSALASAAKDHALPASVGARIVADVARGLEAVHALGIVHRDVSPQNVLVSDDGRASIADFGVAKIEGGGTASGFVKGKVRYMAPEQAYAEPVDARTDVYALGIVLLEATTGRHPFAEETDVATLGKIASGEDVPLPEGDAYPSALRAIVARAVAQEPGDRFQTMDALAVALEGFSEIATREDVARFVRDHLPQGAAEDAPPLAPERRARSLRAALGVVLVGVVAIGAWHVGHPNVTHGANNASSANVAIGASASAPPNVSTDSVNDGPAALANTSADPSSARPSPVASSRANASRARALPSTTAPEAGAPLSAAIALRAADAGASAASSRPDVLRTRD